ncbi:MAG: NUDIX hydrolase [bacterium]|nr:NUDIX hydrolase [bacterium]
MENEHLLVKITQKALIIIDHKLLLVREGKTWELPGGRVDKGEMNLPEALKRELLEELSLRININDIFTTYLFAKSSGEVSLAIIYKCEILNPLNTIKLREGEVDEYKLFSQEELSKLENIFPNSIGAINKVEL